MFSTLLGKQTFCECAGWTVSDWRDDDWRIKQNNNNIFTLKPWQSAATLPNQVVSRSFQDEPILIWKKIIEIIFAISPSPS